MANDWSSLMNHILGHLQRQSLPNSVSSISRERKRVNCKLHGPSLREGAFEIDVFL